MIPLPLLPQCRRCGAAGDVVTMRPGLCCRVAAMARGVHASHGVKWTPSRERVAQEILQELGR